MDENLVLVVHGIGEQAEGETLDALVGGAVKELPILEAVNSRKVMVAETARDASDTQLQLFPVHIRETVVKAGTVKNPGKPHLQPQIDQRITAAEVYWSDLSPAPNNAFATMIDLFRVVLGLGYLALDNIENNGFRHPMIAASVRLFVWIFYTLIAPMNVVLLLGAFALLVDPYLGHITDGSFVIPRGGGALVHYCSVLGTLGLFIALSGVFWFKLRRKNVSYLARNFMRGYTVLGILFFVVAVIMGFGPTEVVTNFAERAAPKNIDAIIAPEQQHIASFVNLCIYLLGIFWLMGVLVLVAMTVMSGFVSLWAVIDKSLSYSRLPAKPMGIRAAVKYSARQGIGDKRLIYLAICTAMLLLWMLFSTAFWSTFSRLTSGWIVNGEKILLSRTFENVLGGATQSFSYILLVFLLLVVTGAFLALLRVWKKNRLSQGLQPNWQDVWLGRLILNPVINILLVMGMTLIVIGTLYVVSNVISTYEDVLGWPVFGFILKGFVWLMTKWSDVHDELSGALSFGLPLAAFAGVLVYNFAGFFASALGVGRDIVVYSTRSHGANPVTSKRSSYLHRDRIEDRFAAVLAHMTRGRTFDRIVVIAHSQGTVIAARQMELVRKLPSKYPPLLFTMGSPLSHIYEHYFSAQFQTDKMVTERNWHNVYRRDDFVGTRVNRVTMGINNHPVPAKGHTNYWTDQNVWEYVRRQL